MRKLRSTLATLLLLVCSFGLASAQPDLSAKLTAIEKAIDAKREELHVPGASLAIIQDDRVVYLKGLGLRNVEQNLPVTPKTQFAVGSTSKAFAAMTVMMCADEEKLTLTDSPKKYLPHFSISDPAIDASITISDLLSHRSGLERTDIAWYTGKLNTRDIFRVVAEAKPTAKLGERFQYQNVMFLAAGEVVAKVQKKPWTRFLAERIFRPLGMNTSNTDIRDMQRQPDYAQGYVWDADRKAYQPLPARQIRVIAPAGAINSNAEEMAQWVRLMLNGGVIDGKRLISEKSFAELTKPRISMGGTSHYGYGWMLRDWRGQKVVEHGGNIDGFNAQVAYMPEKKVGFVLLTNISASPLGTFAMNTVWENLVGGTKPVSTAVTGGPAVAPEKEAGKYKIAGAPVTFDVTFGDGKLVFTVAGQPPYPLVPLGGRRYKLGSPAPDGFFVTFRPAKEKKELVELFLEQPHGNALAVREGSAFQSPVTAEELMRKTIEALGGEANLRKHRTVTIRYDIKMETQGVSGFGVEQWRIPGARVDQTTLIAAGKKIATIRDCFDGKQGATEMSFAGAVPKQGKALANAVAESAFVPELDWKKLFKSVEIVRIEKVEGEECFVVEAIVDKGDKFVRYISSKSYLPVKSETPSGASEVYMDYAEEGGIKIPFKRIRSAAGQGASTLTVKSVRFGEPIAENAFRPRVGVGAASSTGRSSWAFASTFD